MNIELDEIVILNLTDDNLEVAASIAPTYTQVTSGFMYVCQR